MTYRHGFLLHLKVDELSFVHKSDFEWCTWPQFDIAPQNNY
jgi:hypothetical protein